jgi:hypothetical protein
MLMDTLGAIVAVTLFFALRPSSRSELVDTRLPVAGARP